MPYHGGHELLVKLSTLLQTHGNPILRQESQLCLTATSLVFLNQCFQDITAIQQGENDRETKQWKTMSYRDSAAIAFIRDFLRRTPSLRLVPGTCSHFDGLVNISCFRALQVLEIKKVPVGFVRGFQSLRPQLKTLICTKSLISLNEVFVLCGGDRFNVQSAWPHLKNVDFSYNGIVQVDASVKLLPALKVLNLSHNCIQIAEGDDSLSNWKYLSEIQHLNLGYNQIECIPVPPAQGGVTTFQNMTTLILKNNNLQNLKGLQAFSKLRFLDVSFNCIASLTELTPLAFLHDLISLNLQGNPVVFCQYYRRATVACLYPIPRVEPIKIDGKPLDAEEQVILGRNVYPVSMLSYIPESPSHHPRVSAIRKEAEELLESSESQEESDPGPKHRKPKRKSKKGRRVVAREIDFDGDNEVSVTDDFLSSTSYTTPAEQTLEHADDVEQLKKLRQLGGEDWLPAIDHVVHVQEEEAVDNFPGSAESPPDQVPSVSYTGSRTSFSEDKMEINSRTSTCSISVISDEDISEALHFVVTLMSTPNDDDMSTEPLFVTIKDDFVIEKNFTGKVISQLETSCLKAVYMGWTADSHPVTHLRFDYISRERQSRDYVMEDHEAAEQLVKCLEPFVTSNEQIKVVNTERLQCLKCSAEFTKPVTSEEILCPDCGSSMTVLVSSPVKQEKPVFTVGPVGRFVGEHVGAANLNTSSIKTLNGDMSVTALVDISTSSSSSTYLEAVDQTQESETTDSAELSKKNIFPANDKEEAENGTTTEKNPDVIPKETLDRPAKVPDLCSNTSGKLLNENGKDLSPAEEKKVQKKFEVKESGRYKVNSDGGKFVIKNGNSSQTRTSALSYSLKRSSHLYPAPQTQYSSSTPSKKHSEDFKNSIDASPSISKPTQSVIDGVQSTPETESELSCSGQYAELLSKSVPAVSVNMALKDSPKASTMKRPEKLQNESSSFGQRKTSQSAKTDKGTPKSSENTPQQVKLSTSAQRSPTPKMFFNNLINRLGGRMPGSSLDNFSLESRSTSTSSSRASTPSLMEPTVALSFRLSADEFRSCDHKLKLYFEVSLFRWGSSEEFRCMLKAPVVVYGSTAETPCLMIISNIMCYICRFSLTGCGTPDECLTPLVSHPLSDLMFIDSGLGSQSFRLEFSTQGGCYDFLVRGKDRCEEFLSFFIDVVQQAQSKAGSRPVVVMPPHPQTLQHIRSRVFGMKLEDPIAMGERLYQQLMYFTDPPIIKDRKSLLRSYSNCFVGREFVDWLIQVKEVETRDEAVGIGQKLLDAGALEHVSKEQQFEDKDHYYRFNTERGELGDDLLAGESLPDMDTSIVLFIMAHRCSNTEKPRGTVTSTPDTSTLTSNPNSRLSFHQFKKLKEDERAKKIKAKKQKTVEDVKIQVGVMEVADGHLKKVKGRTLPLMVPTDITAGELLKAATAKQGRHFKQFNQQESYFLLYPDQTVVNTLPGSAEPFVLNRYKEELGKPFSKLYFWLCSTSDMENLNGDSDSSEPGPSFLTSTAYTGMTVGEVEERGVSQKPNYGTSNTEVEAKASHPAGGNGTCPTCSRVFPLEEIEIHADLCADSCLDPVGELDGYEEYVESEEPYRVEPPSEGSEHEGDMSQKLKEVLKTIQQNVDSSKKTRISIRRKSMFHDYIEARKKKWFNSRQTLKVTFIGEPAIDDGGPLREFFTEVLKHIQHHLFPDGMPVNSMTALAKNEFTVAGELMAASVVQGGPAPCFLSKEAFGYIVDGIDSVSTEDWIPKVCNEKLKGAIEEVRSCSTDEELRQVLLKDNILDILSSVGYRGVPTKETLSSKEAILRPIVMTEFQTIIPMLDQLRMGLESFCLLEALQSNKDILQPLFVEGSSIFKPTRDLILDSVVAEFSNDGTNAKIKEIDIFKYFHDFIMDCSETGSENDSIAVSQILKFISGLEQVPPLGLPDKITVKFKYFCNANCQCRPTASTCDPSITFPLHYDTYDAFCQSMSSALVEGCGFGFV